MSLDGAELDSSLEKESTWNEYAWYRARRTAHPKSDALEQFRTVQNGSERFETL